MRNDFKALSFNKTTEVFGIGWQECIKPPISVSCWILMKKYFELDKEFAKCWRTGSIRFGEFNSGIEKYYIAASRGFNNENSKIYLIERI